MSRIAILAAVLLAAASIWADTAPIRTVSANLYEAGVEGSRRIGQLKQGDLVEILAESPGWIKVSTPQGQVGWVRANGVDLTQRTGGTTNPVPGTAAPAAGSPGTPTRPPDGTGASSAGAPKTVAASGASGGEDVWSRMGGGGAKSKAYAAGKGFSEDVERGYRKNNPNLEAYYGQIDGVLLRMEYNRPVVLERFRRQGYLGEFAAAAPRP